MLGTASLTLLALLVGAALTAADLGSSVAAAHLAFAVGIVPLIFAAMIHFVPVLTRTGDPSTRIAALPTFAQGAGLLAVLAMQGWVPHAWVYAAAAADLFLAGFLLNWIAARARSALGAPHPGWRWYGAALGCLMLALLAVLLMAVWPAYWPNLRLFHLHMNSIGLLGLAALGTLPVLMPTALGKPDPEAAGWLRRRLWLVAGGAVVVATGTAIVWPLAAPGAALVMVAILGLVGHWIRRFGLRSLLDDGVTASLLSALLGFTLMLSGGVAHGAGLLPGRPTLFGWAIAFLLPLVTGALSQLLPVWRWPGPQIPARTEMRRRLAASGRLRAALFLLGGMAAIGAQARLAAILAGVAMALFVSGLLQAVRVRPSPR